MTSVGGPGFRPAHPRGRRGRRVGEEKGAGRRRRAPPRGEEARQPFGLTMRYPCISWWSAEQKFVQ